MVMRPAWPLSASLLLAACSPPAPPAGAVHKAPQTPAAPADTAPGFTNKVWKVGKSSGGHAGMLYVFLSDGTLLITSAQSTPSLGRWRYAGDTLTLVEEGIAHPAAVLKREADELTIRFPGPGTPLELTFVPAVAP